MYILKICRCCDSIVGELDTDEPRTTGMEFSFEVVGNVAYTLCSQCMRELDSSRIAYFQ